MMNRAQLVTAFDIIRNDLFRSGLALLLFATAPAAAVAAQRAPTAAPPSHGSAIARDPRDLPAAVGRRAPQVVRVTLAAQEVVAPLDPDNGVSYLYWTYNGKVPGPMIRVRVGDTVEVTLRNSAHNRMVHSIDLHAVLGPGGGAALMQVPPGQSRTFSFVATTPGLFAYHCGTPMIAEHIANGMYGLILVEPPGGLPPVDHEYYVMQGEIYTSGPGSRGQILTLDESRLMAESPQYFVLNGSVGALTGQYPLSASVGETVRIFFGNAGPNATSSPHMVGEIFTRYYAFGSLDSPPLEGVQTATVPPGAAAIFELKANMPGQFAFMDHAIARMQKGLVAYLNVTGVDVARLMYAGPAAEAGATPALAVTPADAAAALLPTTPIPASIARSMHAQPGAASAPVPDPVSAPAAEDRIVRSYLDALGTNPGYADYAKEMFRLFRANPAAVPVAWREVFRNVSDPAAVAQPVSSVPVATTRVTMTDSAFVPSVIEIQAGQAVTWQNTSATIHTLADDAALALKQGDAAMPAGAQAFVSPFLQSGQSYTRVFNVPGIYRYVCTQHERNGMVGTIIVKPAAGAVMPSTMRSKP